MRSPGTAIYVYGKTCGDLQPASHVGNGLNIPPKIKCSLLGLNQITVNIFITLIHNDSPGKLPNNNPRSLCLRHGAATEEAVLPMETSVLYVTGFTDAA